MINILKLRKLQKETPAQTPIEELKTVQENLITEQALDNDNTEADSNIGLRETERQLEETIKPEISEIVADNDIPVGKTTNNGTNDINEEPGLSDGPSVIDIPEVLVESTVTEISATEISLETDDPSEILRRQLMEQLLQDEEMNQRPDPEAEAEAERQMLKDLLEANKQKAQKTKDEVKPVEIAETLPVNREKEQQISNPKAGPTSNKTDAIKNETENVLPLEKRRDVKTDAEKKKHEQVIQLAGFSLGNEYYGVEITSIREIIRLTEITTVPRAPEFIEGVINLRGSVIPVINLRTKVRMPRKEYDKSTRIIIMELKGFVAGFIVDAVREVLRIPENLLVPPPDLVAGSRAEYITAVAKLDDKLVILMDPEKLLSKEENAQISEKKV